MMSAVRVSAATNPNPERDHGQVLRERSSVADLLLQWTDGESRSVSWWGWYAMWFDLTVRIWGRNVRPLRPPRQLVPGQIAAAGI